MKYKFISLFLNRLELPKDLVLKTVNVGEKVFIFTSFKDNSFNHYRLYSSENEDYWCIAQEGKLSEAIALKKLIDFKEGKNGT